MKGIYMTQTNSRPRVKEDGISEQDKLQLFALFPVASIETFREQCIILIEKSNGKDATKLRFKDELNRLQSKTIMMQKVTNYFLAGEGKGV